MPKAIELIKEAIRIEPENFNAHKKIANYMFQDGLKDEAIDYLKEYFNKCSILHKSSALDQIAVLLKKNKNIKRRTIPCIRRR